MKKIRILTLIVSFFLIACKKEDVTLGSPDRPIADMLIETDTATHQITFVNKSKNAISYKWYFGDGDSSELVNPTHQFFLKRTYNITLVAEDQSKKRHAITKALTVNDDNINKIDFKCVLKSVSPFKINFIPNIPQHLIQKIKWNFGNNQYSEEVYPLSTYTNSYTTKPIKVGMTVYISNHPFVMEKTINIGPLLIDQFIKGTYNFTNIYTVRGGGGPVLTHYPDEVVEIESKSDSNAVHFWSENIYYQGMVEFKTTYTRGNSEHTILFTFIYPDSCKYEQSIDYSGGGIIKYAKGKKIN
jgi:PKD repeat protein